jgi:HK97 family phage major capsid protein
VPLSDFSGIIPHEYSQQIIEEVTQQSTVLQLAQLMPMGTRITEIPIAGTLPSAQWITGTNLPPGGPGRKQYTDLKLSPQVITAEEIAAVVAIPDQYLEDNTINLWTWARSRLAEAIAVRLDETVLFGGAGIPATFPVGGVAAAAYSLPVTVGIDAVDGVNRAMGAVEAQGLAVNGHAADLSVKSMLRGVRDETGALLLGTEQADAGARPTLYSVPIAYSAFAQVTAAELFTGAWQYLVIGVRQDIRFRIEPAGVIADASGAVQVSGFQDNVTPCKIWARFACGIVKPVTKRVPAGATPFAKVRLSALTPPAGGLFENHPHGPVDPPRGEDAGTGRAAAKK